MKNKIKRAIFPKLHHLDFTKLKSREERWYNGMRQLRMLISTRNLFICELLYIFTGCCVKSVKHTKSVITYDCLFL